MSLMHEQDPYPLLMSEDPIECDLASLIEKQEHIVALSLNEEYFVFDSEIAELAELMSILRAKEVNVSTDESSMEHADIIVISERSFCRAMRYRHKILCYCIGLRVPCVSAEDFLGCLKSSNTNVFPLNPQLPLITSQRCLMRDIWCRYGIIETIPLTEGSYDLLGEAAIQEIELRVTSYIRVSGLPEAPTEILMFAYEILLPIVSSIGGITLNLSFVGIGKLVIQIGALQVVVMAAGTANVFDEEERARVYADLLSSEVHGPSVRTAFLTNGLIWELYQYWPETRMSNKVQIMGFPLRSTENQCLGSLNFGPEAARNPSVAGDYFRALWSFGLTDYTYDLLNCIHEVLVKLKYHYIMAYEPQQSFDDDELKLISNLVQNVQKSSEFTISRFLLLLDLNAGFKSRWVQALRKQSTKIFITQNFAKYDETYVFKLMNTLASTPVA